MSLFPGPLWPGVVAPDKVLSIDPIELMFVLTFYAKLNCLKSNSALNDPKKVDTLYNKTTNPLTFLPPLSLIISLSLSL